ncbi:hypothetical protein ACA910_014356 [Epithemia clementina (nom. ined.)]
MERTARHPLEDCMSSPSSSLRSSSPVPSSLQQQPSPIPTTILTPNHHHNTSNNSSGPASSSSSTAAAAAASTPKINHYKNLLRPKTHKPWQQDSPSRSIHDRKPGTRGGSSSSSGSFGGSSPWGSSRAIKFPPINLDYSNDQQQEQQREEEEEEESANDQDTPRTHHSFCPIPSAQQQEEEVEESELNITDGDGHDKSEENDHPLAKSFSSDGQDSHDKSPEQPSTWSSPSAPRRLEKEEVTADEPSSAAMEQPPRAGLQARFDETDKANHQLHHNNNNNNNNNNRDTTETTEDATSITSSAATGHEEETGVSFAAVTPVKSPTNDPITTTTTDVRLSKNDTVAVDSPETDHSLEQDSTTRFATVEEETQPPNVEDEEASTDQVDGKVAKRAVSDEEDDPDEESDQNDTAPPPSAEAQFADEHYTQDGDDHQEEKQEFSQHAQSPMAVQDAPQEEGLYNAAAFQEDSDDNEEEDHQDDEEEDEEEWPTARVEAIQHMMPPAVDLSRIIEEEEEEVMEEEDDDKEEVMEHTIPEGEEEQERDEEEDAIHAEALNADDSEIDTKQEQDDGAVALNQEREAEDTLSEQEEGAQSLKDDEEEPLEKELIQEQEQVEDASQENEDASPCKVEKDEHVDALDKAVREQMPSNALQKEDQANNSAPDNQVSEFVSTEKSDKVALTPVTMKSVRVSGKSASQIYECFDVALVEEHGQKNHKTPNAEEGDLAVKPVPLQSTSSTTPTVVSSECDGDYDEEIKQYVPQQLSTITNAGSLRISDSGAAVSQGSPIESELGRETPVSVRLLRQMFEKTSTPLAMLEVAGGYTLDSAPCSGNSQDGSDERNSNRYRSKSPVSNFGRKFSVTGATTDDSVSDLSGPSGAEFFAGGMEGFHRQQKLQKFHERQKLKETWIRYHCDKEEHVVVSLLSQPSAHATVFRQAEEVAKGDKGTVAADNLPPPQVMVDYNSKQYQTFVFLVHNDHGLVLLQCSRKDDKLPHWQLPGGKVDGQEFEEAAKQSQDRQTQLILASKAGAARELFIETGMDFRSNLDRFEPAQLRALNPIEKAMIAVNELKDHLFFFLQVGDEEFPTGGDEDSLQAPCCQEGSTLRLKLSDEHCAFTFVLEPSRAAEMLLYHSGGICSDALLMAMSVDKEKMANTLSKRDEQQQQEEVEDQQQDQIQPESNEDDKKNASNDETKSYLSDNNKIDDCDTDTKDISKEGNGTVMEEAGVKPAAKAKKTKSGTSQQRFNTGEAPETYMEPIEMDLEVPKAKRRVGLLCCFIFPLQQKKHNRHNHYNR